MACYRIRNALLFGDGKTDGRKSQSARQASAWQGKGCLLFWSFSICVLLRRFECMCRGPVDNNPQWTDFCQLSRNRYSIVYRRSWRLFCLEC